MGEKEKAHFSPHKGKLLDDCFRQYTRLLCNTQFSIQGPLLSAAIEEEGERKMEVDSSPLHREMPSPLYKDFIPSCQK